MLNQIQVIGNIGQDAIINEYNGNKIINFSVAHTEKFKNSDGVANEKTTWFNCAIWIPQGKSTELAKYLKKGSSVFVQGSISVDAFLTKDNKHSAKLKVKVDQIKLLSVPKDLASNENSAPAPSTNAPVTGTSAPVTDANGDDLPF